MQQTKAIHQALKRYLRQHNHRYKDVAKVLNLSEPSIKRLFAQQGLSLERLEKICDWLGLEIGDLVALSKPLKPLLTELSVKQEQALLAKPELLLIAYLTLNHWQENEILDTFDFTQAQLTGLLIELDKVGVIELLPFNRIKLRTARNFSWRKDGPVERYFRSKVMREFFRSSFNQPGEAMHFVGGMLSRPAIRRLHQKLEDLAREFDHLIEQDLKLPASDRFGCSMVLALRPWELSAFTAHRRKGKIKQF